MSEIKPALSPEEWARGGVRRGDWEEGPGTDERGRPCLWTEGGACGWGFDESEAAKMAALCLHGRITWEMVDALREGAVYLRKAADGEGDVYRRQDRDEWWNPVGEPGPSGTDLADATDLVADLLESLLPPRA